MRGVSLTWPTSLLGAGLQALRCVDEVVIGDDLEAPMGLDFQRHFLAIKPQVCLCNLQPWAPSVPWILDAPSSASQLHTSCVLLCMT
jgi:hypothetical protein